MKIRSILVASLLVVALVSVASAEMLVTANPLGQGKWGVLGGYLYDSNYGNNSSTTNGTVAGYIGYGVTDKLDLYVTAGSMTASSLGGLGLSALTGSGYGLNAKYTVINEGAASPVSVALGAGLKTLSATGTVTGGGNFTSNGSQWSLAVGCSKMMAPFVPYGALAYRSQAGDSNFSQQTQLDLTVGSAIAWSAQGAVFVEDTISSITPNGKSAYTGNQVAVGVGYKI